MTIKRRLNPYEILRLNTNATIKEVIDQSKELTGETMDTAKHRLYRMAAEEIRQHPVRRACNQFWEPPDTRYEDEVLERFRRKYSRPPVTARSLAERRKKFIEEDCSVASLTWLAMPPVPLPVHIDGFDLQTVPEGKLDLAPEPQELLL